MSDKRKIRRLPVTIPVQLLCGDKMVRGVLLNLSARGMFVRVPGPLAPKQQVHVRIAPPQAPGQHTVHIPAQVVHIQGGGAGLRIQGPLDRAAELLLDHLMAQADTDRFVRY
jgi:hypothetical protein